MLTQQEILDEIFTLPAVRTARNCRKKSVDNADRINRKRTRMNQINFRRESSVDERVAYRLMNLSGLSQTRSRLYADDQRRRARNNRRISGGEIYVMRALIDTDVILDYVLAALQPFPRRSPNRLFCASPNANLPDMFRASRRSMSITPAGNSREKTGRLKPCEDW